MMTTGVEPTAQRPSLLGSQSDWLLLTSETMTSVECQHNSGVANTQTLSSFTAQGLPLACQRVV